MQDSLDVGTMVAVRFLRDYQGFGSRGHLVAASSISDAIASTQEPDAQKLLAVKLFTEFMAALEGLGALCIAVRHRDEGAGLVYSYLTYGTRAPLAPTTTLSEIYSIVREGDGLSAGLNLPSLGEITDAHAEFSNSALSRLYFEANVLLSQASNIYLIEDRALVRAYNKTKHGFVVVNDQNIFQPDLPSIDSNIAWIVAKNPSYDPRDSELAPMVELFAVRLDQVQATLDRLPSIRGAIRVIAELTAELLELRIITCANSRA